MIINESMVNIIDNTGALKGKVIRVLKGPFAWVGGKYATVGDKVVLAVKQARPDGSVKSGDVVKGVVVRTTKEIRRSRKFKKGDRRKAKHSKKFIRTWRIKN